MGEPSTARSRLRPRQAPPGGGGTESSRWQSSGLCALRPGGHGPVATNLGAMVNLRIGRADEASLAYLLAGLVATAVFFALPSVAAKNVAYDAIGASAVAAMLIGVGYHRPAHR